MFKSKKDNYFFYFMLVAGIILRLVWNSDMEWKDDEQWMFTKAHEAAATKHFPEAGMQSGGGIVNPGMSVIPFAVIASFTTTPLEMNRVVQLLNIAAMTGFLLFILVNVQAGEKETWLLGLALASVSPLAVLFSRKIWAQDLLPFFSVIILFTNAYRQKSWCAFLWGLTGALIGQIHMSGFFFAAGLFAFTALHDHYTKIRFRWLPWITGSIIGSISIFPWISFMLHNPQINRASFWHIFQFNFYICWFLDSQGLNIMYSIRKEFWEFIKGPFVAGVPTYFLAIAQLFLAVAGIFTVTGIVKFCKRFTRDKNTWAEKIFLNISQTRFYLFSILLGLGIFMTLSGTTIYTHYLICAFPFSYIFVAKILEQRKLLFQLIAFSQLLITAMFLLYVHQHNGVADGNYGIAYHAQQK